MVFNLHFAPDLGDFALGIDQESGAFDAHIGPAIKLFLNPGAIGFADFALFVADKWEGKFKFFNELTVRSDTIL